MRRRMNELWLSCAARWIAPLAVAALPGSSGSAASGWCCPRSSAPASVCSCCPAAVMLLDCLANRVSTIKGRMAERTAAEDAWDDQQRAKSGDGKPVGVALATEGYWTGHD